MLGWIEIFKTGTHMDSQGRERTWTTADLDKMANSYDPARHEAPVVVGHPKSNDPAYGWVEKIKRAGTVLLAKLKQVEPAFSGMVRDGRFKKRSISVFPDGSLRHVGFLGAAPPAVAGLKDIAFAEGEAYVEYEQFIMEESMDPKEMEKKLEEERAKRKAAEKQAAEFRARAEKSEAEQEKTAAEFSAAQAASRKKEIADFIDAGIKDGNLLPGWKERGLGEFMEALEETGGEYEFCEGKSQAPADWFREFLASFSAHPLFKEMSRSDGEQNGEDADFAADEKLAEEMAALVNPAE